MDRIIKFVLLSDIFVDLEWNSRSAHETQSDVSDGVRDTTLPEAAPEGLGLVGLVQSFADNGQDTPVVCRPVDKNRSLGGHPTSMPLELVCGFRRILAAHTAGLVIKNVPEGHILAEIRELSPQDAELLNLRENLERSGVTTPDLVRRIVRLQARGMSLNQISVALRTTRSHVSLLARIGKLPDSILQHWRGAGRIAGLASATRRLTSQEMSRLAEAAAGKSELEATELYKDLLFPKAGPTRVEQDLVEKRLVAQAHLFGRLVQAGILLPGTLDWHRIVGPKKEGFLLDSGKCDAQVRARYWEAMKHSYELGLSEENS